MSSYFTHSLTTADFHHGSDYPSAVQGYPRQPPHYPAGGAPVNYSYNYGAAAAAQEKHFERPQECFLAKKITTFPLILTVRS